MQKLYSSIFSANAIILGSPIYMGQISGQTKIFIDRLYAEFHPRFSPQFKEENGGKKLALVFTQGNPDKTIFETYYNYTKTMFQKLEFDVLNPLIIATGTRSIPVSENNELLFQTTRLGRLLCGL